MESMLMLAASVVTLGQAGFRLLRWLLKALRK